MFKHRVKRSAFSSALVTLELIYHSVVRSVRSKHNNALIAIGLNMLQVIV